MILQIYRANISSSNLQEEFLKSGKKTSQVEKRQVWKFLQKNWALTWNFLSYDDEMVNSQNQFLFRP